MNDVDSSLALAVLRALQLNGWEERLSRRLSKADDFLQELDDLESEINVNSNTQRELIISELEHLKELIDCKKEQLLSKNTLELQRKQTAIGSQRDTLLPEVSRARELRDRVAKIQALESTSTFLAVCSNA